MKQRLPEHFLPPPEASPKIVLPSDMHYPPQLNACQALLDKNLEAGRGSRTAIHQQGRPISYEELGSAVETFAAALRDQGIVLGDRVLIRFWNQPEFVIAWL